MRILNQNRIVILFAICCGILPITINALTKSNNEINQYVLLDIYADAGPYLLKISLSTSNLSSVINNCGLNCQLVKLSTIPASSSGELKVLLNDNRAGCSGEWSVPFKVVDNQLVTNSNVYVVYLQGTSCVTQKWSMEVLEDVRVKARYKIDITKVN